MNITLIAATILFVMICGCFAYSISNREVKLTTINCGTWLMLTVIGLTHAIISFIDDRGFLLALIFGICCLMILVALARVKGTINWWKMETLCCLGAIAAFLIWHSSSEKDIRVAAAFATFAFAGMPLLHDLQKRPDVRYCSFFVQMTIASGVFVIGTEPHGFYRTLLPGAALAVNIYLTIRCFFNGDNESSFSRVKS